MSPRRVVPRSDAGRRGAAAAAICGVALAACVAPAGAWVEKYSFDDVAPSSTPGYNPYAARNLIFYPGCSTYRIGAFGPAPFGPRSGNQAMVVGGDECPATVYIYASNQPRTIQYWVRSPSTPRQLFVGDSSSPTTPTPTTHTFSPGGWTRVQIVKPPQATSPGYVPLSGSTPDEFLIDDIATSDQPPAAPPATIIDSTPPASSTNTSATVAFHNADPGPTFTCQLDSGAATPCTSPWTRTGLTTGAHTLRVRATGLFGVQESTPKTVNWTVSAPQAPTTPTATTPAPTTLTGSTPATPEAPASPLVAPTCPPGPDADRDGVPDACDFVGAPGTVPPVSGQTTNVKVESGVVFIKLPPGVAGARAGVEATRQQAPPAPGSGYVPLKGVATIPVGSSVDARGGSITVTSATGASAKGASAPPSASAKLTAAIFQIRQDRLKRRSSKSKKKLPANPTALVLRSPEGAIAAARCRDDADAVIRSLSAAVPKGTFQFVGAAASVSTSARAANIRTVDRCDGTFTEVGRGVATVTSLHRKHRKVVRVKAGRAYLMKGNFMSIEGGKGR